VGAGKSLLGCMKGFMLNLKYPGNKGLICRKESTSLKASTMVTLFEQVIPPEMIVNYDKQKGVLEHKTSIESVNSFIVFSGLDKKADQSYPTKIGSTEYGWIFVDEGVELSEGDWDFLNTRLRYKIKDFSDEDNSLIPRQMFTATNPDSPNHWMFKFFFTNKNNSREVILTSSYDNPYLPKDYLQELENNLVGIRRQRLLEGKWVQAEGVIYDSLDLNVHVVTQDVINKQIFVEYIAGADSNYPLPRACVLIGVTKSKEYFVVDEFYREKSEIEELRDWLEEKAKLLKQNILVFHDPSDAQSIAELSHSSYLFCEKANNAVIPGISTVAGLLNNKRLFINAKCSYLIGELQGYVWRKGAEGEVPLKENDHLCDGLRYGCHSFNSESSEFFAPVFMK